MKKLIGSISVALTLALSVFGLAACDLVNFNWGTGSDHEHHFTVHEATDPTCAKNGNVLYYKCDVGPNPCGRYYIDLAAMEPVSEESVMIPALGHEYDFDNIVWSEWNGKEITASVTCTQCDEEEPGHVLNPKITVEFTQTKAPTCTAKGEGYYTASFTYEGETYTNPTTNAAEVDMIPHTYNKVPDDGWKWADGHTSVSATFTCTAADCTHTETVTVSGAAITSKVETIKGVCTDGSQTVYTATAEFNGETYDLTDTVVTRAAINEHKVGDWQYDATQHWHKCSVCGEDMDDKASHQVDSSTHKCECGYEEESYTVTAASINAADGKVVLTINGTCTGYTQETLAAAFKTFGFYGGGWTYPASEDFTLTLTEKAWTITVDVTKMDNKSYSVCLESESGYGDIKPTFEVTGSAELNNKTYTLSKNGDGNLTLTIADKAVEKTYAITDASIAAEGEAVYVTVSGTFAGYSAEEFLAALQDDKTGDNELAFCVFYDGTGPSDSKWGRVIPYNSELIEYDAKEGGTFTVKINVTSLEKNKYKIGKDNADYADIKNLSCTGTATVGDKKYDLAGDTGGLALVVSDKPDESKARDLTGISLTAEGGRVYLVYTGTFKGYSEGEMTTYLTDEEIFYFWGNGGALGQKPASRAATFENGKWTLKLDVTDMPDDTEYALCWKDNGASADLQSPLAGGSDTVQTVGDRIYTLIANAYGGYVRLKIETKKNTSFTVTEAKIAEEEGKAVITLSGTYAGYTKEEFTAAISDNNEAEVGFRIINASVPNWNKVAGLTSYEVGDDNTFTVKFDVTNLDAENPLNTNRSWYVNQETGANSDIKSLTEKYDVTITVGTKTYQLVGTPGKNIALFIKDAPAPTPVQVTLEFADAYGANDWLFFWVTSEVDISVESGTTVKVNGEAPVATVCNRNADGRYEFRVQIASNKLAHYEFKWYNENEECIAEGSWDQEFTVTVTVSGNEDNVAGTVTLKQGEKAVNSGEKIAAQSELTLTVTVNEAYRVEVLVNNNAVELQDDVHTFVLDSNTTIYVNFTKIDAEVVAKELTILSANFYNGNFLTIELSQEDADYVEPYTTVVINNHADTTHFHMKVVNSYQIQVDVADYEQDFTIEWFNSFGQKVAYASYKMTSGPEEPPAEKKLVFAGLAFADRGQGTEVVVNINTALSTYTQSELAAAESFVLVFTPTEGAPIRVTCAVAGADGTAHHFPLATVTAGTYTVTLEFDGKTFECPAASGVEKTDSDPTYKFEIADGKLTLTVTAKGGEEPPAEKDPKITSANLAFDPNLLSFIFNTENCTQEILQGAKLLVNGEESSDIRLEQVAATGVENQFKAIYNIASLGEGTYTLVYQLNGTDYNFVDNLPGVYTYNNKTYTLANAEGKLQLTVAAVAPAADGSQDAPFSVSDLAAIFEGDSFNEEGYYTKDSEAQEVYVKGMVKSYDAASKQVTLQQIETRGGVLTVALSASELKIVIGEGTYNGSSTEGMTFVVGDVLTVKGYLQKGEDTLTVTGKDGTTSPTIEVWESANKDTPALDAEADKAALEEFFAALIEEVKGMEDLTKEFVLPLPTRPGVTFAFNVKAGDAAVTITDGKVIKVTRGADAVEVTIEATIKVAGAKSDFTVDGSPFTFTVPQTKPATVEGSFTITAGSVDGFSGYGPYAWSEKDTNGTIGGHLYAYKGGANPDYNMQFSSKKDAAFIASNLATPGPITSIVITSAKGATARKWMLYTSVIPYNETNKDPSSGNLIKVNDEDTFSVAGGSTVTVTVNDQDANAYYFALAISSTDQGATNIASITINYKGAPMSEEAKLKAQAESALDGISFKSKTLDGDLDLPTVEGVTFNWEIVEDENTAKAVLNADKTKVTVTKQEAETSFTLKVTVTCGTYTTPEESAKTFTFTVKSSSAVGIEDGDYDYDFAGIGNNTKALTTDELLSLLNGLTDVDIIDSIDSLTGSVYKGQGTGGNYANSKDLLKVGTSSKGVEIHLTFAKAVSKIVIDCESWKDKTSKISVNGGAAQTTTKNTRDTFTFEFEATTEVTLKVETSAILIWKLTVTVGNGTSAAAAVNAAPVAILPEKKN